MGKRGPKPGTPKPETSILRVRARELKANGLTYAQIGQIMGFSRQRAHELVAPTKLARKIELEKAGNKCADCGKIDCKLDWHHEIYSENPSRFLCTPCHKTADRRLGYVKGAKK